MSKVICYEADLLELSPEELEVYHVLSEDIDKVDSLGYTLLLAACATRNLEYATYCLQKGANPNHLNDCGDTPLLKLIDTAEHNEELSIPIIKALIDSGANLELRGYMDKTPFLQACSRSSLSVLKLLVESGCNTRATVSEYGEQLDGNWFADCSDLDSELKEYIKSVIKNV